MHRLRLAGVAHARCGHGEIERGDAGQTVAAAGIGDGDQCGAIHGDMGAGKRGARYGIGDGARERGAGGAVTGGRERQRDLRLAEGGGLDRVHRQRVTGGGHRKIKGCERDVAEQCAAIGAGDGGGGSFDEGDGGVRYGDSAHAVHHLRGQAQRRRRGSVAGGIKRQGSELAGGPGREGDGVIPGGVAGGGKRGVVGCARDRDDAEYAAGIRQRRHAPAQVEHRSCDRHAGLGVDDLAGNRSGLAVGKGTFLGEALIDKERLAAGDGGRTDHAGVTRPLDRECVRAGSHGIETECAQGIGDGGRGAGRGGESHYRAREGREGRGIEEGAADESGLIGNTEYQVGRDGEPSRLGRGGDAGRIEPALGGLDGVAPRRDVGDKVVAIAIGGDHGARAFAQHHRDPGHRFGAAGLQDVTAHGTGVRRYPACTLLIGMEGLQGQRSGIGVVVPTAVAALGGLEGRSATRYQ